jgi:hypothetical protein
MQKKNTQLQKIGKFSNFLKIISEKIEILSKNLIKIHCGKYHYLQTALNWGPP